jgi:hypothetical protein
MATIAAGKGMAVAVLNRNEPGKRERSGAQDAKPQLNVAIM